jgi:hypothetical protein
MFDQQDIPTALIFHQVVMGFVPIFRIFSYIYWE